MRTALASRFRSESLAKRKRRKSNSLTLPTAICMCAILQRHYETHKAQGLLARGPAV